MEALCETTLNTQYRSHGPIAIGDVAVAGSQAVVVVEATVCLIDQPNSCVSNHDPKSGLVGLGRPGSLGELVSQILGQANDSSCQADSLRCSFAPPYGFDLVVLESGSKWRVDLA